MIGDPNPAPLELQIVADPNFRWLPGCRVKHSRHGLATVTKVATSAAGIPIVYLTLDQMVTDDQGSQWPKQVITLPRFTHSPKWGSNCFQVPDLSSSATIGLLLEMLRRSQDRTIYTIRAGTLYKALELWRDQYRAEADQYIERERGHA